MRIRVRVPIPNCGLLAGYGVRFHVLPSRRAASSLLLIGSGSRAVGGLTAGVLPFKPNNDAGLQFQILMCPYVGLRSGACGCGHVFLPLPLHRLRRAICTCRSVPSTGSMPFHGEFTRGSLPSPRPRPGHGSLPSSCSRPTMEKTRISLSCRPTHPIAWHDP